MKCGEGCMPTCANMCHYMPTWANIAVSQLCRERQPLWNSHDGLNKTCFINAMMFVPMSLHHEGDLCRFACRHQCFFLWLRKQQPRFAQAQPKGYFHKATNFTQTPKKNKNEFRNCHLAMLGRVAKPIFTSRCPGQPFRVWVCEWITGFKKWNRLRAIGY